MALVEDNETYRRFVGTGTKTLQVTLSCFRKYVSTSARDHSGQIVFVPGEWTKCDS